MLQRQSTTQVQNVKRWHAMCSQELGIYLTKSNEICYRQLNSTLYSWANPKAPDITVQTGYKIIQHFHSNHNLHVTWTLPFSNPHQNCKQILVRWNTKNRFRCQNIKQCSLVIGKICRLKNFTFRDEKAKIYCQFHDIINLQPQ